MAQLLKRLGLATGIVLLLILGADTRIEAAGTIIMSPDTEGDVGWYTSLELDSSGFPVVAYYDYGNRDLKVLHCGNPTCTSNNSVMTPVPNDDAGTQPSLVLDTLGRPVISYFGGESGGLRILRCGNPNCSSDNTIVTADPDEDAGLNSAIALDNQDRPVVSYGVGGNARKLKVLICGNQTCSEGNSIVTPDDSPVNGYTSSLVLDSAGIPVVAYDGGDLKVLHCGDISCTAGNSITAVEGNGGQDPSIALDSYGNPVISYSDGQVQVLRCGNPACNAGNSVSSPDTGIFSQYAKYGTSLALDSSDRAIVSYYVHELRILHCGNATCTSGNSIAGPDTGGHVGAYSSLELDAAGRPVISYSDSANGDLRVVRCGDPTCMAGNTVANPDTTYFVGDYTTLALDPLARPVIAYTDNARQLRILRCTTLNCLGSSHFSAIDRDDSVCCPSLALDANGHAVVAYREGYYEGRLMVLHCLDLECSQYTISVADDGSSGSTGLPSLVLDSSGFPVVSYHTAWPQSSLRLVHCGDASCASGNSVSFLDYSGVYSSLALDNQGNPVIAYSTDLDEEGYLLADLRVMHCNDPNCIGGDESITVPDAKGEVGYSPSLVLDAEGNPVVAYFGSRSSDWNDFKILHCGDPNCSTNNVVRTVDVVGWGASDTSLKLDAHGNPVASYYDNPQFSDLGIIHCGDPTCSSDNTIVRADTAGRVGLGSSLELDSLGNPIVSYTGYFRGLKVLHCGNPTCGGKVVPLPPTVTRTPTLTATNTPTRTSTPCPDGKVHHGQTCATPTPTSTPCPAGSDCSTPTPTPCPPGQIRLGYGNYCGTPGPNPGGDPNLNFSMGIDTNGDSLDECGTRAGQATTCHVAPGNMFTVQAYLDDIPDSFAYEGFAIQMAYIGVAANEKPNPSPWPDCGFAASASGKSFVNGACAIGIGGSPSTYTGLIATTKFTCAADGTIWMQHQLGETLLQTGPNEHRERGPDKLVIDCGRPSTLGTPTATPTPAPNTQGGPPGMALQVYGDTAKQQLVCDKGALERACDVGDGTFSVDVHTDAGPSSGFQGYQAVLQYSGAITLVNQDALAENRWPRCSGPGLEQPVAPAGGAPGRYTVGCAAVISSQAQTYDGVLANVHFACKGSGTGLISLIGGAGANVSFYHRPSINGNRVFLASEARAGQQLADAVVVECGSGAEVGVAGADTDGDGCSDAREAGSNERAGGLRDYLNPWDFFEPTGDHKHRVEDILRVVQSYLVDEGAPGYTMATDRTILGPGLWNLGPPNGQVRVDDILSMVRLYFHDCA